VVLGSVDFLNVIIVLFFVLIQHPSESILYPRRIQIHFWVPMVGIPYCSEDMEGIWFEFNRI